MNKLIAILLISAVFLSGCVGQPTAEKITTTTATQPTTATVEDEEFSHDLDQALDDLSQVE